MANMTINLEIQIGVFNEASLEIEVDYNITELNNIEIVDYYAYHVEEDDTGHPTYERVPYWMHKMLEAELEDIKYDLLEK